MSAAPGGPAAHPRPRLRPACRLGAEGGRRADSAGTRASRLRGPGRVCGEAGAGGRGGQSGRGSFVLRGPTVGPAKGRPRGAGARRGRERVGAATHRTGSRARGCAPAPPWGCARPSRRVGGGSGGCPAPTGRSHVWRGPGGVAPSAGREDAALRAQLCLGFGAPRPVAAGPSPAALRLPAGNPICAGRELRAAGGARCSAAEVGVFHHPGRVKLENKLRPGKLGRRPSSRLDGLEGVAWPEPALGARVHVRRSSA